MSAEAPAQSRRVVFVSSCMTGKRCLYHGWYSSFALPFLAECRAAGIEIVDACAEMLGGLKCPRPAARVEADGRVYFIRGRRDVTLEFYLGASRALEILQGSGASVALLLAGSPSCDREFGIFGKEAAKLVPVVRCKRDLVGWESQARFYLHLPPPHRTFPQ